MSNRQKTEAYMTTNEQNLRDKNAQVNHPNHYETANFETIDVITDVVKNYPGDVAFAIGNVIKYIFRAPIKSGTQRGQVIDLQKAQFYLNKAVELAELHEELANIEAQRAAQSSVKQSQKETAKPETPKAESSETIDEKTLGQALDNVIRSGQEKLQEHLKNTSKNPQSAFKKESFETPNLDKLRTILATEFNPDSKGEQPTLTDLLGPFNELFKK